MVLASLGLFLVMLGASLPASAVSLLKEKDIIIYQDRSFYSAFPSLVVRPDGEILCAFRRAPSKKFLYGSGGDSHSDPNSYMMLVRSSDNAKSWTKDPQLMYAHPFGGSQDPCMFQMASGGIICTSYAWALVPPEGAEKAAKAITSGPHTFLGGFLIRSADGGRTWSNHILPPAVPGSVTTDAFGNPTPSYNRGQMMQKKDGTLLWAVCAHNRQTPRLSSVHLLRSTDKGLTWSYVCPVAEDDKVTFNETSLIETAGGDIVAFLRTDGFDGKLAVSRSTNGGKSFQQWQDGVLFGHPFQALRLPDDRVLLVYGYRRPPFGVRARVLSADCSDYATAEEFIVRDDGGNVDVGYPWAAMMKDGRILVSYYINIGDGPRHIAGSILKLTGK